MSCPDCGNDITPLEKALFGKCLSCRTDDLADEIDFETNHKDGMQP